MTSGALPDNPFVAAGMIEDPRLFVGRKDELHAIASRMKGDQPTSINIVGEKHIGKSSLLHYFVLTWQQRVLNSSSYVVIYLPLRGVDCQTETGFYEAVAEGLLSHVPGWQQRSLQNPWKTKPLNCQAFSDAVKQWKQQGKLPVLCLDDFESLLKYPDKFDNGFYDNLRSLMDSNALMLVVASRERLDVYANEHRFVSRFFNIAHTISLNELTTDEAIELSRLPTRSTNGAALSVDEQNHAQQWGNRHPYKLQLAGYYLWEARQQGKDIKWAKQQFKQQLADPKSKVKGKWWQSLLGLLWDIPLRLGRVAAFIGASWDDVKSRITGMLILQRIMPTGAKSSFDKRCSRCCLFWQYCTKLANYIRDGAAHFKRTGTAIARNSASLYCW
ncbi:AAA family ATPase [Nostoc sp. 'Lobaria pulmonaria (5183) cyanobiont']|uniref:AAA family ATPase n=1 Tax=Nostoc sp. 'Lobaria pulmonaria (5183) cyanobiont' TaxID=1618022 RepID=UPI000CF3288E|nr:AAA family ATPase [Nostoc sp. 'Lobaria pulmonaria (5183) cyanobiont']AVH70488.1 AAA ATPase [Nostoc sp. 'Lobaria pulmonaria (5183) cyanobiont']